MVCEFEWQQSFIQHVDVQGVIGTGILIQEPAVNRVFRVFRTRPIGN